LNEKYTDYILCDPYFAVGLEGLIEIIKIYSALSCSNAEVESGFSYMNRIKLKLKIRYSQKL